MQIHRFIKQVLKGLKNDQYEIRPGQAQVLYDMHNYLTKFIQGKMNKSAIEVLEMITCRVILTIKSIRFYEIVVDSKWSLLKYLPN